MNWRCHVKGFAIDSTGDLLIDNNEIQMVEGEELLKQTVQSIIGTNKGEWFLNENEGIEFSNILGKGVTEEMVKAEIEDGLQQVDDTLSISDFSMSLNERCLTVTFTATNDNGSTEIEVTNEWD